MSINMVILQGNVGKPPEIRHYPDGTPFVNFSLATNEGWKNRETGERVDHTEWHRCVAKRRTAEIVQEFVGGGDPVFIEGKNRTRKYTDKDGIERWVTEVQITKLTLMGGKGAGRSADDELDPQDASSEGIGPQDL